jgi:putative two-component system response regulator
MMPVMDGMTMLEHLRADPITKDIPVILLTALNDRKTMQQAQRLGIEGYLVKAQFSIGEMLDRIRQTVS